MATNLPVLPVLLKHHLVERYSPWEIEDSLDPIVSAPDVASFNADPKKYTHLEVDAAFMFSNMVVSSTNQSHNQCVRTSYATKHRTQAAGTALYPNTQPENNRVSLDYPMTPLVDSAYNHMAAETFSICATQVVVMAVMSDARASDDGIVINKSSIERGLFNITRVQDYHAQAKANHTICVPSCQVKGRKASDYSKLGPDGVVKVGSIVVFNDVLIGIVFHDTKTDTMLDKSVIYPKVGACKVVNVQHATNKYGVDSVSVTLQQIYNTQVKVGDKLASTHSQKGVVVAIVCASEMPVVAEGPNMGMPVDLIFNPQGLPTRMTPGAVEEGAMGLYAAKFGKRVNATVFETKPDLSREDFVAQFGDAKVAMMNPSTGQLYPSKVAVLLSSYYRLDQLASEKLQVRDGGPKDPYNQPKAGKANNGGLRVGLMESAAYGGHGATEALYERHVLMSDAGTAFVCSNSECSNVNGDPIVGNADSGLCRLCNAYTCKRVDMPYTTACLVNHLESAGIHWSLKLENVDQQGLKGACADEPLDYSVLPYKPHHQQLQQKRKRKRFDRSVHTKQNNYNNNNCNELQTNSRKATFQHVSQSGQEGPYQHCGRSGNYKDAMALHGGPFSGPSVSIERCQARHQARPHEARKHQVPRVEKHRQQHEASTARPTNTEAWTSSDDSDDDFRDDDFRDDVLRTS
jgi:DNA-directed RNA polymerase beta subunit